jgi:hypothetical protein
MVFRFPLSYRWFDLGRGDWEINWDPHVTIECEPTGARYLGEPEVRAAFFMVENSKWLELLRATRDPLAATGIDITLCTLKAAVSRSQARTSRLLVY